MLLLLPKNCVSAFLFGFFVFSSLPGKLTTLKRAGHWEQLFITSTHSIIDCGIKLLESDFLDLKFLEAQHGRIC